MKSFLIIISILFSFNSAMALGGYAAAGLGYSYTDDENSNTTLDGGSFSGVTKLGFSFSKKFSLGLALVSWLGTESSAGTDTTTVLYPLAVEGNWHLIQDSNGPYIGLQAATVLNITIVDGFSGDTTNTSSDIGYGAQAGWNFALGSKQVHSIGLEFRYLNVADTPGFEMFNGYVFYSFWFGNR